MAFSPLTFILAGFRVLREKGKGLDVDVRKGEGEKGERGLYSL